MTERSITGGQLATYAAIAGVLLGVGAWIARAEEAHSDAEDQSARVERQIEEQRAATRTIQDYIIKREAIAEAEAKRSRPRPAGDPAPTYTLEDRDVNNEEAE